MEVLPVSRRVIVLTEQDEVADRVLAILHTRFSWLECLVFQAQPNNEQVAAFAAASETDDPSMIIVVDSHELDIDWCTRKLRCDRAVHISHDFVDDLPGFVDLVLQP